MAIIADLPVLEPHIGEEEGNEVCRAPEVPLVVESDVIVAVCRAPEVPLVVESDVIVAVCSTPNEDDG
jgi:hypothetical protein